MDCLVDVDDTENETGKGHGEEETQQEGFGCEKTGVGSCAGGTLEHTSIGTATGINSQSHSVDGGGCFWSGEGSKWVVVQEVQTQ
jgi:hypothetical protein